MNFKILLSTLFAAMVSMAWASLLLPAQPAFAQGAIVVAQTEIPEKEAYDAAKELGTIEAWEAFLNNFPTGFRADLARAYLKRIASEAPPPAPVQTLAPPPPPPPPVEIATPPPPPPQPLAPINLGPGTSPWGNGVFPMDEGNSSVYSASVKSSGLELVAYCGLDQTLTMLMTERPPGVYPQFSGRIEQGLAASQLSMQFSNGSFFPVAASVQGLTGDVELRSVQGSGFNPNGPIAEGLMSGNSVTLSAPPFGATFQLTKSRAAICNVVNSCGVSVAGCQRFTPPAVTTRQPALRKKTITRKSPAGKCSSRSVWLEGQCILKSAVASYCGPGFHREGSKCVSNANRAATAPAGCQPGFKLTGGKCVALPVTATRTVACTGGRVANANGECVCTGLKVWRKGKCKNPKAEDILKQITQPKAQPKQLPPQTQQQQNQNQQLQQGINNLLNQFSDERLKRGVTHLATLSSGIRLYAFRYLWEDKLRVGVLAQDLLANPAWRDAVSLAPSGYYRVDYGALGLRMVTLEDWRARGLSSVMAKPSGGNPNPVREAFTR